MTSDAGGMTRRGVFLCVAGAVLLLLVSVVLLWWVCAGSAAPPPTADDTAPAGPDSLERLKAFTLDPRPGNLQPSPLDALNRRDGEPSFRPGLPAEVVAVVGPWRGKQYLTGANVIAPSRDGRIAAGGRDTTQVTLHAADTFEVLDALPCPDGLLCLAFSADGRLLVAGGVAWLTVWDVGKRPARPLHRLRWKGMTALTVGISPDGRWLAAGGGWCKLKEGPPGSPEGEAVRNYLRTPYPALSTPSWEFQGGWFSVWQLDGGGLAEWLRAKSRPDGVTTLAFSPDSGRLVTGDDSGEVAVWQLGEEPQNEAVARNRRHGLFWLAVLGASVCCAIALGLAGAVVKHYRGHRPERHRTGKPRIIGIPGGVRGHRRGWPRRLTLSFRALFAVIGVVASGSVLAIIGTLVSAESPPEKIAPWRAATRTGGVEAVAFAPDGQTVYACGPEKSRRRYRLDGHRYPPKAKGSARAQASAPSEEDSSLLVLRWGLTGSQLADLPLWHLHSTPSGLGILLCLLTAAALALLSFLWWLMTPYPGDFEGLVFGTICIIILAIPVLLVLVQFDLLSIGVAWLCGLAVAAGLTSTVTVVALARWCWPISFRLVPHTLQRHRPVAPARWWWLMSLSKRAAVTVLATGLLLLLLVGSAAGLMLLTARVPQLLFAVKGGYLPAAAFGPDAGTLALAVGKEASPRIEVREAESGNLLRTEAVGLKDVRRLAVDTTGICLVATSNTVHRLSGQGAGRDDQTAPPEGPGLGGFLGDGKTLVLLHQDHLRLVDLLLGTGQTLPVRRSQFVRTHLVTSLRSTVLACSGSSKVREDDRFGADQVLLWTLPEKTPRVIPLHGEDIDSLALSDDGKRLAVTSTTLRKKDDRDLVTPLPSWLRVFDVPSGKEVLPRQKVKNVWPASRPLTFSPRGDVLVEGIEELHVWDLNTGRPSQVEQKNGRVFQIRFSPDGRRLIAVKHPGNLEQHWKDIIEKSVVPAILEMILEPVSGADSRKQAAQDQKPPAEQAVLIWTFPDLKPGKSVSTPYEDEDHSVLSPDGRLIGGTNLRNRRLLIHQWETGKMLYRPLPIPMSSCVFAPDGRHVAVSLSDGTVIVLRL
jgi:WD40 repeat protein